MNKESFKELAEKISTGVATDQEIAQFNNWYQSFQQDKDTWLESEMGDKVKLEVELLRRINRMINAGKKPSKTSIFTFRRIAAAVIVLVFAAGSIYWYLAGMGDSSEKMTLEIQNDVAPGGDKAVLTLGDGSTILLDEANKGLLASEGNTFVRKSDEGLITYQSPKDALNDHFQDVKYNTISTPEGGQYKVVLPDETEVWLNALSSIKFPTRFVGETREVEITGEVYFEVTKNEHQPFQVRSGSQVVKVLGTHFNIQAYKDESSIQTTLVEGSVIVETETEHIKIIPGQQVINDLTENLKVEKVDTEQVIAWKNGLFHFWDTDLQEIMRQLSRWYHIEVDYQGAVKGRSFTGFISRDVSISNVLAMLEETGEVKFGVKGNRVIVQIIEEK